MELHQIAFLVLVVGVLVFFVLFTYYLIKNVSNLQSNIASLKKRCSELQGQNDDTHEKLNALVDTLDNYRRALEASVAQQGSGASADPGADKAQQQSAEADQSAQAHTAAGPEAKQPPKTPMDYWNATFAEFGDEDDFMDGAEAEAREEYQGPDSEGASATHDDEEEKILRTPQEVELIESIKSSLMADRIEILVQPIVNLPQRKVRHFEFFSRVREKDGTILTPDNFLQLSEEEELVSYLDNAMLIKGLQQVRKSQSKQFDANFFINLSGTSCINQDFIDGLIDFLRHNRQLSQHLVLEFHMRTLRRDFAKILPSLTELIRFGCRFSVDNVSTLQVPVKQLKMLNFRYVKVETHHMLKIDREHVLAFFRCLEHNEIDVIASKVESEEQVRELHDYSVGYGQGYLFGVPVVTKM